jgi:hypothetical protein
MSVDEMSKLGGFVTDRRDAKTDNFVGWDMNESLYTEDEIKFLGAGEESFEEIIKTETKKNLF